MGNLKVAAAVATGAGFAVMGPWRVE